MRIMVSSIPSDQPEKARKDKVRVAIERQAAGLPYDEGRIPLAPLSREQAAKYRIVLNDVEPDGLCGAMLGSDDVCIRAACHNGPHVKGNESDASYVITVDGRSHDGTFDAAFALQIVKDAVRMGKSVRCVRVA